MRGAACSQQRTESLHPKSVSRVHQHEPGVTRDKTAALKCAASSPIGDCATCEGPPSCNDGPQARASSCCFSFGTKPDTVCASSPIRVPTFSALPKACLLKVLLFFNSNTRFLTGDFLHAVIYLILTQHILVCDAANPAYKYAGMLLLDQTVCITKAWCKWSGLPTTSVARA